MFIEVKMRGTYRKLNKSIKSTNYYNESKNESKIRNNLRNKMLERHAKRNALIEMLNIVRSKMMSKMSV